MKPLIDHTLVLFSILVSGSLYYTSFNDDLFLISFLIICLFAYAIKQRQKLSKYYLTYALISITYLVIHPFLINNISIINTYIGYAVRITSFLFVISILGYNKFTYIYVRIILILCLFNLLIYTDIVYVYGFFKPLSELFPHFVTWDNIYFENYIFYARTIDANQAGTLRNPGIFWEGGAYQYFLNLALIINLYFHKRPIFSFSNFVFIASIITTYSTTGYIIMIVTLLYIAIGKPSERHIYRKMIIILPFLAFFFASSVIFNKLFNKESPAYLVSTQRRMLDTVIDFTVFVENPILGIGLGNNEIWLNYSRRFNGGTGSSSGLLHYLSMLGLIGFLITLYPFMKFKLKPKKNKMILLCNLLTVLTQGIMLTPIFLLSMSLLNQKSVDR